jgi:protein O-GlcNAc transferase
LANFQRVLKINPDHADAHVNAGIILHASGRIQEATAHYQRAIEINPNSAEAHCNLGNVHLDLKQLPAAVAGYRRGLAIKPDYAEAYCNMAFALQELGQAAAAEASCRAALRIRPDFAEAYNNLGNSLKSLGQLDQAAASFRRATEIKPDFAEAHNNLGAVLTDLARYESAASSCSRALRINPRYADAYCNLGNVQQSLGQYESAVASYRRAAELRPDFAEAHSNLGVSFNMVRRYEDALLSYRRALEIKPDFAQAHNNLGHTLKDLGQLEDAMSSYRRALELDPGFTDAQSNILFTLNFLSGHSPADYLTEARQYGRLVAAKATRFCAWTCEAGAGRLRVGLVSGDFRNHSVGHFLEGLVTRIDPARIELLAYPTDPKEDDLTARIRPCFSAWKPLYGLGDEAAARLIHADGVHVLLDLSGHTASNRLPVFAWKPAPVQATWLGFLATTGLAEMDYLLADATGVPESQRGNFTEAIWYLPDTFLCFTPPVADLGVTPLPALQAGHVTFGCFQNLAKVGEDVLDAWGRILAAQPGATLRIQAKQLGDPAQVEALLARLQRHGIDRARVATHPAARRLDYLAAHAEVDIILDTFPYPGGTTTCEALWMGVPTLTLAGGTLLARQGASVLAAAGLADWVAQDTDDYVARAVARSSDLARLESLRATLRQQVLASPLFDAARFARNFEDALWGMWQVWNDRQNRWSTEVPR